MTELLRRPRDITYGEQVHDLARIFIVDTMGYSGKHVHALAMEIQTAIESYLASIEDTDTDEIL